MKEEAKLPFEIEVEILKYLSPKDLKSMSLANKDWSEVIHSNETWNILHQTRFKDIVDYGHTDAKASYIREHLKSIYCASKRLGITWGDSPQYWERVTDEPCESGEIARLKLVFWFDVTSFFPHILNGIYQPVMRIRIDNRFKSLFINVKVIVSCESMDLYHEYPFSFEDNGGNWQIVHLPAIDIENDSLVKLQLQDHSGAAKRGLDLDYFALAQIHKVPTLCLSTSSQPVPEAASIIGNLRERIIKYSHF